MDKKVVGTLLGVAGVILWFMPLAYVDLGSFAGVFHGMQWHQAGHHIGGIAYLLLISSAVYAAGSWLLNKEISIISSVVALGISVLFMVQAGSNLAWGLIGLFIVSLASLRLALQMNEAPSSSETE